MQTDRSHTTGLSPIEIDNLVKDLEKYYDVDCLEDLILAQHGHIKNLKHALDHYQALTMQRYYTRVQEDYK